MLALYSDPMLIFGSMKPAHPNRSRRWSAIEKWGADVVATEHHGFVQLPDALIRYQSELGITALELCLFVHVLRFWWYADESPHPRISLLAREMGVSRRTVERAISSLETKGLMVRARSEQKGHGGPMVRRFLFPGLKERLRQLVSAKEGYDTATALPTLPDDSSLDEAIVESVIDEIDHVGVADASMESKEVLRA